MASSEPPFPLPLPAGWVDRGSVAGARIAIGDPGFLLYGTPAGDPPDAEILVLDTERVRCRGGVTAERTLLVAGDGRGRSLTVEHWRYPGSEAVAVLPTGAYAALADTCTAALRGRRPGVAPALPPPARADFAITVHTGRHPGTGGGRVGAGVARVELPGLDGPRELPATALPAWLAGLVGLGPRPRATVSGLLVLPRPALGRLAAGADPARAGLGTLPDAWAAALAGISAHWQLDPAGAAGPIGAAGAIGLEVVDATGGLFALSPADPALLAAEGAAPDDEAVAIRPTTPSAIWRHLAPPAA